MIKVGTLRIVVVALVALLVVSGTFGQLIYGVLCSLDVYIITMADPLAPLLRALGVWRASVAVTCPLGYLERSLASMELLPQWPTVLLTVFSVILLGRVFCAWVCPTVLLRRLLGIKAAPAPKKEAAPSANRWAAYSPYAILAGVLVTSWLFKFPVFCFFCPIGLFFGALYAVIRLASPDPLSVELLLFPLFLGIELVVLKSWCRTICPLGALLSIFGNLNRFFLPTYKKDKCLTSKGVDCHVCERACPEGIKLPDLGRKFAPQSCTKCLECWEKCPGKSVEIALFR